MQRRLPGRPGFFAAWTGPNEGAVQGTVRDLRALEEVLEVRSVMRVAGEE